MNENLDLVKILEECPRGMKLYSPFCGEVELDNVGEHCIDYPIMVNHNGNPLAFTCDGRLYNDFHDGECVLFPSKDQRDWSKFKAPVEKFDYSTLQPFDKVLVRYCRDGFWKCDTFSHRDEGNVYCVTGRWKQIIPYNEETKYLLGTTGMPDEKYIWWEE